MKSIITSNKIHKKVNTTKLEELLRDGKEMHALTGKTVEIELLDQPHRIIIEKDTQPDSP